MTPITTGSLSDQYGNTKFARQESVDCDTQSAVAVLAGNLSACSFPGKADQDEFSANEVDQKTFTVRPSLRWEFYDNFTLEGAYTFNHQINDLADTTTDRHVVWLQIAYGLPLMDILERFGAPRAERSMRDDYTFPQR